MYEYYHVEDIAALTEKHKAALQTTEVVTTAVIVTSFLIQYSGAITAPTNLIKTR